MTIRTTLFLLALTFASLTCAQADEKKTPTQAKPTAAKSAEGTFVRIDEGDYFHWVMTDKKGEEVSYFIMSPDASVDKVIEEPGKFVGKKCRIQWKTSTENIPEAGGKLEIDQILSVEWRGKK